MFTQNKNYKNKNVIVGSFLTISEDTTIEAQKQHLPCHDKVSVLVSHLHAHAYSILLQASSYGTLLIFGGLVIVLTQSHHSDTSLFHSNGRKLTT